ncbi:hypothetical protein NQ318_020033 [Aromia moschata]|uniref:AGC-kinase C-terminal domain-containing protein n=1 Tax=Aromia moschata TaxID=1265417 RepID=A0AAV8ZAY2_9CUCU|nr:hypothetical protein NQ318_020033 [Aromia moschata]
MATQKESQEDQVPEVSEQHLSVASVINTSAISRNKNRSIYVDVLDRLKKEFYQRWERRSLSSAKGLDEFVPIKTLGTGSFGRVKSGRAGQNQRLDRLKRDFIHRWQVISVSTNKGFEDFVRVKTIGVGAFGSVVFFVYFRFGNLKNGVQDIKGHRWFKDIDWIAVYNRQVPPPFVPAVKAINDASNFSMFQEEKMRVSEHELFKNEFENF